ncbi:MAG: hypothetical protein J6R82_03390 [Clostridia bacterium]|nr:hypothetical protein [Clostridia bacterium]
MFERDKTTRRIFTVCLIVVLLPVLILGGGRLYNDALLNGVESDLCDALEAEEIAVIESKSVCGKLNGNGNGMNFFAAALVKATPEALDAVVSALSEEHERVSYVKQTAAKIDLSYLEHRTLIYDHKDYSDGEYYTVYVYDSGLKSFPLDVRGH